MNDAACGGPAVPADADGGAPADRIRALVVAPSAEGVDPDVAQERRVAVYDLLEENTCRIAGVPGPYALHLDVAADSLRIDVTGNEGARAALNAPLRDIVDPAAEYLALCADYRAAIRRLAPSQIERIDSERRALHEEGSVALTDALGADCHLDPSAAKRLFTVVCAVLQGAGVVR